MKNISKKKIEEYKRQFHTSSMNLYLSNIVSFNQLQKLNNVSKQNSHYNPIYNIKVEPQVKSLDQKKSGLCWLYSCLNIIRPKMCQKYNLENFEFSTKYLLFWHKFENFNFILQKMIDLKTEEPNSRLFQYFVKRGLPDSGQWNSFVNLVLKYGLVPETSFKDSVHRCKTEELNDILHLKLLNFTKKIRSVENPEKLQPVFMKEIFQILCIFLGVPPNKINFEYEDKKKKYYKVKNITPLEFFKKHVPIKLNDYVVLMNDPRKKNPYNRKYQKKYTTNMTHQKGLEYLNVPMTRMKTITLESLKSNESVWFGADTHQFLNKEICSFDIQAVGALKFLNISMDLDKEDRIEYNYSDIFHAMVITGANVDKKKVSYWQIINSWNNKEASEGYYNMSDKWFEEYGFEIVVLKKFLNANEKKILRTPPIIIEEPWDPL